jgi:hypothetical protein
MSDKKVYACCEGIHPLGDIDTPVITLINNLKNVFVMLVLSQILFVVSKIFFLG